MTRTNIIFLLLIGLAGLAGVALAQDAPPANGNEAGRRGPPGGEGFFARHDVDKDGKLTLEELCGPAKKLLAEADQDGDEAVSREEFDAHKPKGGEARGRGRGKGGQGGQGGENRGGARGRGGRGGDGPPPAAEIFKKLDTDGNGVLSLEEFEAGREMKERRGRGGPGGGRGGGGRR